LQSVSNVKLTRHRIPLELAKKGGYSSYTLEPGYVNFLWHYFTFQPWPEGAFAGSEIGITWMHLWYLPYLLFYTLLFIPVARWLERKNRRARLLKLRGGWLIVLPVIPLTVYASTLFPVFGGVNHTFITDWYAHAMFFTLFAYGYLIAADAAIWDEIRRMRWLTLGLAICAYLLLRMPTTDLPGALQMVAEFLETPIILFNRWLWILTILGWSYTLLNRPYRWLAYANEAVYPWYILHQTITVWIGFHIARYSLGPVVEPMIVIGVTILGCLLLHELLIRRNRWLRPLFGLKPMASSHQDLEAPTSQAARA